MNGEITPKRAVQKLGSTSHLQKKGLVTIPGKMKDDLAPATMNSILKQAGLK